MSVSLVMTRANERLRNIERRVSDTQSKLRDSPLGVASFESMPLHLHVLRLRRSTIVGLTYRLSKF